MKLDELILKQTDLIVLFNNNAVKLKGVLNALLKGPKTRNLIKKAHDLHDTQLKIQSTLKELNNVIDKIKKEPRYPHIKAVIDKNEAQLAAQKQKEDESAALQKEIVTQTLEEFYKLITSFSKASSPKEQFTLLLEAYRDMERSLNLDESDFLDHKTEQFVCDMMEVILSQMKVLAKDNPMIASADYKQRFDKTRRSDSPITDGEDSSDENTPKPL